MSLWASLPEPPTLANANVVSDSLPTQFRPDGFEFSISPKTDSTSPKIALMPPSAFTSDEPASLLSPKRLGAQAKVTISLPTAAPVPPSSKIAASPIALLPTPPVRTSHPQNASPKVAFPPQLGWDALLPTPSVLDKTPRPTSAASPGTVAPALVFASQSSRGPSPTVRIPTAPTSPKPPPVSPKIPPSPNKISPKPVCPSSTNFTLDPSLVPPKDVTDDLLLSYCYHGEWEELKLALASTDIPPSRISEKLPLPLALPALRGFHDVLGDMVESTASAASIAKSEYERAQQTIAQIEAELAQVEGEIERKRELSNETQSTVRNIQSDVDLLRDKMISLRSGVGPSDVAPDSDVARAIINDLAKAQRTADRWRILNGKNIKELSTGDVMILLEVAGLGDLCEKFISSGSAGRELAEILAAENIDTQTQRLGLARLGDKLRLSFLFRDGIVKSPEEISSVAAAMWDSEQVSRWVQDSGASANVGLSFLRHGINCGAILMTMGEGDVERLGLDVGDRNILLCTLRKLKHGKVL